MSEFESAIREALDARAADIHTALPGKVVRYDAAKQVADVQPMVKDVYHADNGALITRSFPVLPSVPVAFLRGGGYFLTVPLAVGDTGMLIFSELPIDRWRSTGQEAHPVNARRHGVGNAVFYPGVRPRAEVIDEDGVDEHMVLGKEGGAQVHVTANEVHLYEENAADYVALAAKVDDYISKMHNMFSTWTPAPNDGGAALKAKFSSTFATPPGSVKASKVKAT